VTDIPIPVRAIAERWAGRGAPIRETEPGVWRIRCADPEDGFVYEVREPGGRTPVFEDNGRPCGAVDRPEWTVRCVNDAPDAWWTVATDGIYRPWQGREEHLW
jgi:hypothetical protein